MGTIPLGRLLPAARQRANVALLAWCYEAADAAGEVRVHEGRVAAVLGVNPHTVSMGWQRLQALGIIGQVRRCGSQGVRGQIAPAWRGERPEACPAPPPLALARAARFGRAAVLLAAFTEVAGPDGWGRIELGAVAEAAGVGVWSVRQWWLQLQDARVLRAALPSRRGTLTARLLPPWWVEPETVAMETPAWAGRRPG
ncbi:hypothetical protein F8S13_22170 [Chloroflexia bacterium SDU3-3]|nr:hypothetical protein F8S13_22170 [Chloroflexia bacterium SDU3-3]